MKNIIAFCALALCLTHICVRPTQAKEIDCGWGAGHEWDDTHFNELHNGKRPPEGACPPGNETLEKSVITAWVWNPDPPADATGGRRGANRVVQASGYFGVKGQFAEPNIEDVVDLKDPKGPHQNKPTFYLGVSSALNADKQPYSGTIKGVLNSPVATTKTDGGFQWEPVISTDPEDRENSKAGWKIFHRVTISTGYRIGGERFGGQWNLWMNHPKRWAKNALGTTELIYKVSDPGLVLLTVRGANIPSDTILGAYTTSLQSNADGLLNINAVEVRRVVGLTQAYKAEGLKPYGDPQPTTQAIMDGSVVKKLNFTGGRLTKVADFSTNDWILWTSAGSSNGLYPNNKEPKVGGKWVIDFAKGGPTDPRNSGGGYNTGYDAENVEIRMGKGKTVEGK